jgi:hypothetical protein
MIRSYEGFDVSSGTVFSARVTPAAQGRAAFRHARNPLAGIQCRMDSRQKIAGMTNQQLARRKILAPRDDSRE